MRALDTFQLRNDKDYVMSCTWCRSLFLSCPSSFIDFLYPVSCSTLLTGISRILKSKTGKPDLCFRFSFFDSLDFYFSFVLFQVSGVELSFLLVSFHFYVTLILCLSLTGVSEDARKEQIIWGLSTTNPHQCTCVLFFVCFFVLFFCLFWKENP